MGVLLNADADYLSRTGGPAATGLTAFTIWCWHRRTSGVGFAATQDAAIMSQEGNAGRLNGLRFDNTFNFGTEGDARLAVVDSPTVGLFAVGDDHPAFDVWHFYVMVNSGTAGSVTSTVYYSALGSSTWFTKAHSSATENSIVAATLMFGRVLGSNPNTSFGDYAYCGARAEAMSDTDAKAIKTRSATAAGDWGYWILPDAATLTDSSGNSRTLTANGTVTDGAAPTFPSATTRGQPFVGTAFNGGRTLTGIIHA